MVKACEERRNKASTTEEQNALLVGLREQMAAHMEQGCFVKLSARSCKDSILRSAHFQRVLAQQMDRRRLSDSPNDLLRAYVRSQCLAGRRESAEDALEDMLQSRRIYEDLTLALLEKDFSMDIVFREWQNDLVPEMEIRLFVKNGKVTAATQYYSSLHVPELVSNRNVLENRLLEYCHNEITSLIPLSSYTLDVGISDTGQLSVIELNPPPPRSGTGLFVWNYGQGVTGDNAILLGEKPFEFRLLERALPNVLTERVATFEHMKRLGYEWKEDDGSTSETSTQMDDSKCVVF